MASLTKQAKSRFWNACYTDRTGRQLKRSTRTSDKAAALKIALELERVERLAREGQASTFQFQKIVSEVTRDVIGETLPSSSVGQYLTDWLNGIQKKNTDSTIKRYTNTVRRFLEFLGPTAKQPVRSLTPTHIEGFLNHRLRSGLAPKTAIIDIKTLSIALRRAENYNIIDKNPAPAVKLPKAVSSERGVFSAEELHKLVNAAPNQDWQTLIYLGFYVGARLSDCVMMSWECVNTDTGLLTYTQRKTGKRVVVPIQINLLRHLLTVAESHQTGFLCPSLANKTPGGKHGLSESFKRIVKRAEIDLQTIQGKGTRKFSKRTFHSLRHSFSSALANAGISEEVRMRLTGHSSRDIHSKYTHLNLDPLKKAITMLPKIGT
jgi:integrase